jgi:hypothetical protein
MVGFQMPGTIQKAMNLIQDNTDPLLYIKRLLRNNCNVEFGIFVRSVTTSCKSLLNQEPVWGRCYEIILDEVQQEMKRFHGHHMFADFKF